MRKFAQLVLVLAVVVTCQAPLAAQEAALPDWLTLASSPQACAAEGGLSLAVPDLAETLCVLPLTEAEGGGCWCCAKIGDPACCQSCFDDSSVQALRASH